MCLSAGIIKRSWRIFNVFCVFRIFHHHLKACVSIAPVIDILIRNITVNTQHSIVLHVELQRLGILAEARGAIDLERYLEERLCRKG